MQVVGFDMDDAIQSLSAGIVVVDFQPPHDDMTFWRVDINEILIDGLLRGCQGQSALVPHTGRGFLHDLQKSDAVLVDVMDFGLSECLLQQ